MFPDEGLFLDWGAFLESVWIQHRNNVIRITMSGTEAGGSYTIDRQAEKAMVRAMAEALTAAARAGAEGWHSVREAELRRQELRCQSWDSAAIHSFLSFAVRDFLRADLYSALTELLSRAEGSFGVQVHSPGEPGVVVIASKGQPMSLAFDATLPIILFGSEATALSISVTSSGHWLTSRVDLDSQGEVMRLGRPRHLLEGTFFGTDTGKGKGTGVMSTYADSRRSSALLLLSGIEVRSYSLVRATEATRQELLARVIPIMSVPVPSTLGADLVATDLKAIPRVIQIIDQSWAGIDTGIFGSGSGTCARRSSTTRIAAAASSAASSEARTAKAFGAALLESLKHRNKFGLHGMLDLIITGVEVSLWMGEQFAADVRMIFPQVNVTVVSANKLLGLGHLSPERTFFPDFCGSSVLEQQIDQEHTVCLLISQSGQTFPTLHAAFRLADFIDSDKIWLVTGTFNSKIENVITGECFRKRDTVYNHDRVFNNYSGHRPAEPSSVAAVATWHTLSHLLLFLIELVREHNVAAEQRRDWDAAVREDKDKTDTENDSDDDAAASDAIVMLLSDGCIGDLRFLLLENMVNNLENITQEGGETHTELVAQGRLWGAHLAEPWNILVFVGTYIILSVGLGLPIFGLLADLIVVIIRAAGGLQDAPMSYRLVFPMRQPSIIFSQPVGWSIIGAILQFADALWFVFLCKVFTWGDRWRCHRALSARMGKRSIVIVDQPVVHQMLQNFVSKLYSQAYSFVTPEVQSACGQDDFVHVFTHRVVRGLLLAVGRPDGRLGCLAKCENAVLLATKQAAFIRNPAYSFDGSAPEIVTLSHNPFQPAIPGTHLTIKSQRPKFLEEVLFENLHQDERPFTAGILRSLAMDLIAETSANASADVKGHEVELRPSRSAAECDSLDELDELDEKNCPKRTLPALLAKSATMGKEGGSGGAVEAGKRSRALPLGAHLLLSDLSSSVHGVSVHGSNLGASTHGSVSSSSSHGGGLYSLGSSLHGPRVQGLGSSSHGPRLRGSSGGLNSLGSSSHGVVKPVHRAGDFSRGDSSPGRAQVKPELAAEPQPQPQPQPQQELEPPVDVYIDFFHNARETRQARQHMTADLQHSRASQPSQASNDPHARLIFSLKTDTTTREIQDQEHIVQSFYEDRVAALERFVSFCVLFHAMAKFNSSRVLLLPPWDISRSQSYLRVATTASPVSAVEGGGHRDSAATQKHLRAFLRKLRKVEVKF